MFVDGQREHIPEAEWDAFTKEQHELLADRGTPAEIVHRATIQLDGKEVHLQVRVVDDGIYGSTWSGSELIPESVNDFLSGTRERACSCGDFVNDGGHRRFTLTVRKGSP